jgi:hypothetical protein
MSNFLLNRCRYVMVLLVAVMLLGLAGCNLSFEHDPEKTVTVEISGISEDSDRDRVEENLTNITQGAMHTMTASYSGGEMTVQVSPVTDVEKFVQGINFGKVTEVKDRTIRVQFIK